MKCRNALSFASAAFGASSLHAQALADTPAPGLLEQPVVLILAGLGLVLLFVLVAVLLRRRRNDAPGFENTYDGGFETVEPTRPQRKDPNTLRPLGRNTTGSRTDTVVAPWDVPADFDVPRFLRKAKGAFVRLQEAWDKADLQDIRRFTSREVFGEFSRQLAERGSAPNVTEVVTLGAELLDVATVDASYVAKVKFSGMIKEDAGAPVAPFSEIWQLSKPLDGRSSWVIAGIAQY